MSKTLESLKPFEEYTVYGPYMGKIEGRRIVSLTHSFNGSRTSMSYARYLMSVKLERWLTSDEHVDHIDEDKINDSVENLQILPPAENIRKTSATGRTMAQLTCPHCEIDFIRERRQTHLVKGGDRTFCSRSCSAKHTYRRP